MKGNANAMRCYAMCCYATATLALLCYTTAYYAMHCYAMLCYAMLTVCLPAGANDRSEIGGESLTALIRYLLFPC